MSNSSTRPERPSLHPIPTIQEYFHRLVDLPPKQFLGYFHAVFIERAIAHLSKEEKARREASSWVMSMKVRAVDYEDTPSDLRPLFSQRDFAIELGAELLTHAQCVIRPEYMTMANPPVDDTFMEEIDALIRPIVMGLMDFSMVGASIYLQTHPVMFDPSVDISDVEDMTDLLTKIWIRLPCNGHWICIVITPVSKVAMKAMEERAKATDGQVH